MGHKLSICAKTSDCCQFVLQLDEQKVEYEQNGYVPKDLGIGGGDYIELDIDLETGQILNWKKPTEEAITRFIEKSEYQRNN